MLIILYIYKPVLKTKPSWETKCSTKTWGESAECFVESDCFNTPPAVFTL